MHKGRSKVVHLSAKHVLRVPATPGLKLLLLVGRLAGPPVTGRSVAGSGRRLPPRQPQRLAPSTRRSPTLPSVT
jgi:hypothetical protein